MGSPLFLLRCLALVLCAEVWRWFLPGASAPVALQRWFDRLTLESRHG